MQNLERAVLLACAGLFACQDAARQDVTEPASSIGDLKAPNADNGKDIAKGAGIFDFLGNGSSFRVSAHSGPAGEDPKGRFTINREGSIVEGKITCMAVLANRAALGIPLGNATTDPGFYLVVEDNGSAGNLDNMLPLIGPPPDQAGCASMLPAELLTSLEGDVLVVDAVP
jgi:hypothetical protein